MVRHPVITELIKTLRGDGLISLIWLKPPALLDDFLEEGLSLLGHSVEEFEFNRLQPHAQKIEYCKTS